MVSLFTALPLLLLFLINAPCLSAPTRGIRVTGKTGESLYLYKGYRALVIGVSAYQKWPKLPNATNDAQEVASKLEEMGL